MGNIFLLNKVFTLMVRPFQQTRDLPYLTFAVIAHRIVITTHSPYILFALNNCVMGGLVGKNIPEEKKSTLFNDFLLRDIYKAIRWVKEYGIHLMSSNVIDIENGNRIK